MPACVTSTVDISGATYLYTYFGKNCLLMYQCLLLHNIKPESRLFYSDLKFLLRIVTLSLQ